MQTAKLSKTSTIPDNAELVDVPEELLAGLTLTRTNKQGVPYKNNTSRLVKPSDNLRRFIASIQFSSSQENPRRCIAVVSGVKYNVWISNFNGIPLVFAKPI